MSLMLGRYRLQKGRRTLLQGYNYDSLEDVLNSEPRVCKGGLYPEPKRLTWDVK